MNDCISQEKLDWMESVGIIELKQPMKFLATRKEMMYSEDYLKNTPLEKIKAGYERALPKLGQTKGIAPLIDPK